MTDLELTRLCAEAMGYDSDNYILLLHPDGEQTGPFVSVDGENFDPLHDDAQAMALVKKKDISIGRGTGYYVVEHYYGLAEGERFETAERPMGVIRCSNQSLNRAIVECVAKMQAAK